MHTRSWVMRSAQRQTWAQTARCHCFQSVMLVFALTAHAQEDVQVVGEPLEFRQFNRVEITGSSIMNAKAKLALPVRVLDRKELERSGATSVPELLQKLPMMNSFNELGGFNPSGVGGGGYQSAAIHGYEQGTLVLINGRRQAPVALQRQDMDRTTSDLMLLPLSAIDRVEILTDGASSLYGSDAIAGVVNIITKKEVRGLQLTAGAQRVDTAGKNGQRIGLAWGDGQIDRDGYSFQTHLSASHTPRINFKDLPWTTLNSHYVRDDANGKPLYFRPVMSEYGDVGKINLATERASDCTSAYEYALKTQSVTYKGAPTYRCYTPALRNLDLYPEQNTREVHVQFERRIDEALSLYTEASYQRVATDYFYGRSTNAAVNVSPSQSVLIDLESWAPQFRTQNTDRKRWVFGAMGTKDAWDYKLSYSYSSNSDDFSIRGGFISGANWNTLLSPYASQLLQPLASASAELQSVLNAQMLTADRAQRNLRDAMQEINLTASRKVGETDWGDIQLGTVLFGTQQDFKYLSSESASDYPAYQARRTNHGLAGELQVPAWDKLDLVLSGRLDRYSDFGSVWTGKLGGRYTLNDHAFLRASTGTGFRAPTLSQMTPISTLLGTTRNTSGQALYTAYATGNPNLQPEKSRQTSFGLHLTPTSRWSLGLDLWQFNVRDTFGSWSVNQIDADPALKAKYYAVDANGIGRYDITSLNLGTMKKKGVDYHVQHRLPLDSGRLLLALEGTHYLVSERTPAPGAANLSDLGTYQASYAGLTPRNKLTLAGTLEQAQSGWRAAVNYMSGNTEPFPNNSLVDANGRPVGAQYVNQVKSTLTLDLGGWFQSGRNMKWSWFLKNATNETPPVRYFNGAATVNSNNYPLTDTVYTDYRGRILNVQMEWKTY